jgi:hypothetical protein
MVVLLVRAFGVLALLALFVSFGWILRTEDASESGDSDVFGIDYTQLPLRYFPTDYPVALDTTTAWAPLLDKPLGGLRLLDPTFFFRSVHVFFEVRAANGSGAGVAPPATSSVCRRRILVATEYSSTVGSLWNRLSGHGVDNLLSYASVLLPSMKVCNEVPAAAGGQEGTMSDDGADTQGSGAGPDADHDDGEDDEKAEELEAMARRKENNCYVKLRRTTSNDSAPAAEQQTMTLWASSLWPTWNNTWATCDEHCKCALSLPALPRMRFAVVRENLASRDSEFAVTGVQLSAFPPLRLAVFLAALAVWKLHDRICENRLFQVRLVR